MQSAERGGAQSSLGSSTQTLPCGQLRPVSPPQAPEAQTPGQLEPASASQRTRGSKTQTAPSGHEGQEGESEGEGFADRPQETSTMQSALTANTWARKRCCMATSYQKVQP